MKLKYAMLCLLAIGAIAFADNYWNFSAVYPYMPPIYPPVLYPATFSQTDSASFIISGPNASAYVPRAFVTIISNKSQGALSVTSYRAADSPLSVVAAITALSPSVGVYVPLLWYGINPGPMPMTTSATAFRTDIARQNGTGFEANLNLYNVGTANMNNNEVGFSANAPYYSGSNYGKIAFRANFTANNGVGLLVTGSGSNTTAADLKGKVILRDNAGTGNAFACFDSEGKLFRSAVPCPRAQ